MVLKAVAGTLKNNIRTTDRRKNIMVTISIGGTLVKESDDKEKIIERADNLMYQAKKESKDRVIIE